MSGELGPGLAYRRGRLELDGVSLARVAAAAGTPAYVYSAAALRGAFLRFDRAFSGTRHAICYALKANPSGALCRLLAGLGAGAEVVSGGELWRALRAGFRPGRVVFSGVGKTAEEIAYALRCGVMTLNVESSEELDAVAAAARRLRLRAPVSLRLNPGVDARTHRHIATGRSRDKFGVPRAEALALGRKAARHPWLRLRGLHCHLGSQITELDPYRRALSALLGLAAELEAGRARLDLLDIGGGMGLRYERERPLQVDRLAAAVARALKPWPRLTLLLEPGRFLSAEAGLLLTRVLYRKRGPSRSFAVVDAGMSELLRPALYGAHHPIAPAARSGRPRERVDVVGPICESADFLARGRLLPGLRAGELLAVLKAGAYGFSMASQYNSRPRPPELLVEGGRWRVIRARESREDLVRHER